jgi:hypothetical protein
MPHWRMRSGAMIFVKGVAICDCCGVKEECLLHTGEINSVFRMPNGWKDQSGFFTQGRGLRCRDCAEKADISSSETKR